MTARAMIQPKRKPKMAYVVIDSRLGVCFSAPTFERAMERVEALLRGTCDAPPDCDPGSYRIMCVEAE